MKLQIVFILPITWSFLHLLLQTVDVFAIVALSGIMSRLLATGTVLVATSNRAPRELNQVPFPFSLSPLIFSAKRSL